VGGSRSITLRRLLALLLAILGLLLAGLLIVASLQLRGSSSQTRAENRRVQSFQLADSLRQSSNDLTNMVRLYVATGEPRYRTYYNQILAIRSGTAPRPLNYDSSFWDRVLANGEAGVRYGPRESLIARMRAAHFDPDEFRALRAALNASNGLARLETATMARTDALIRRHVGSRYAADVAPLYRRLVDRHYLEQKGVIMAAIQRFIALVQRRTLADVSDQQSHNSDLGHVELAILVLIVLVGIAALVMLTRVVLRPLSTLLAATRRIAGGAYEHRVKIRGVSELEQVAGAFNEMAQAVQTDVAARRSAEAEAVSARQVAEHASRAKTTFLAAMSHEIRTPMIGVTGMLEVLARTELTPQQRQMVATAESSASSLLQIIGDILDFSKIEADRLELSPTTFALRSIVGTAVETFVHTASAKGLLLTWTVDERIAAAHVGDPLRLRQIISNLLSNAVKFTETGGVEVTATVLETGSEAQTIEIAVRDTGIGIDPEQQSRLFAEFTQADPSTTGRYGGTGLGLVICRRLAVLMGGDITLESARGRGTTMRLVVPLPIGNPDEIEAGAGTAIAQATARPRPSRDQAEREGSLVLLAEDHPVNRTVLGHQLELVGFQFDVAEDGQEAFERWLAGRYALVLTDLNMPRMDGYELARAIRTRERDTGADRTPIIALSANVMQGEPERCREAGMDDFAAKPTTIPALAARLRRWLPNITWPEPEPVYAAPEAATDGTAIDTATLEELTGGDAALAATLIGDFLDSSVADADALTSALDGRDAQAVRRQAHRIKGAARIVGASEIARVADSLEAEAAKPGCEWSTLDELASELTAQLRRFRGTGGH
jgi:signal transduction histidine kinase/CheY-like chemotaxis protein/HPt (histidine-containing phosphotransfer) domain-containing protein